jgi:hypothetical protein
LASGFELEYLKVFLLSAKEHMPQTATYDIVLFIKNSETDNLVLSSFAKTIKNVVIVNYGDADLGGHTGWHPSSTRWVLFYNYLVAHANDYNLIFLTDTRDLAFQGDLFEALSSSNAKNSVINSITNKYLHVFEEDKSGPSIVNCGWNSGWIRDCFGQEVLNQVGGNVISCSGTSGGDYEAVLMYLRKMQQHLLENVACERNGVDQGVHNVIVYRHEVEGAGAGAGALRVVPHENSDIIFTLQSTPDHEMIVTGNVRASHSRYPLYHPVALHQYDRKVALKSNLFAKYT